MSFFMGFLLSFVFVIGVLFVGPREQIASAWVDTQRILLVAVFLPSCGFPCCRLLFVANNGWHIQE